jgi:prepilin-type N-terminal cleavage/methylation domain-containing protein
MKKGFTLIELLAVLVILAIILVIAVPQILGVIKRSKIDSMQSDAKIVLNAIEQRKALDPTFDPTQYNGNLQGLLDELGIKGDNYTSVSFSINDGEIFITVEGKGKFDGLVACGTYTNMSVSDNECGYESDIVAPVITLSGQDNIELEKGIAYTELGATATDDTDGSVTVTTTGTVDINTLGTYIITYREEDAAGNVSTLTRTITVIRPYYNASKGVNRPVLAQGMTPIKWSGSAWVDTTEDDTAWYSYDTTNKKWANARTNDGSMWVWIPRYGYQIATGYHTATAGTIKYKVFTKRN